MPISRYHRQMLLPGIGESGQARLASGRVLLVGCGALGSVLAEQLVRAGVGYVAIVDRDIVEWTNLQRQVLFEEEDARQGLPKAMAAAQRLARINSEIQIEAEAVDVHAGNVEDLVARHSVHLICDGTDNVQTRYLINDVAVKCSLPWVYGACVGTEGRVMAIRPGITACLRCVFPVPPAAGELATCDTAGVLGPAAGVVASLQAAAAIKLLSGNEAAVPADMLSFDLWRNRFVTVATQEARRGDCVCCAQRRYEFLEAPANSSATSLCGRDAVQVRLSGLKMDAAARTLQAAGQVQQSRYFVRCLLREEQGISLTVFPDARVIVQGTADANRARSLVARWLGM